MQAELVDFVYQFHQRPGEHLAVWLLCLWDLGVDSIMCTDNERGNLASIMTHPSLGQQLQNSWQHRRGRGSHSLLKWVMTAIGTVWADEGDMSGPVSKWQSFVDLVQILQELHMHQTVSNPNTQGPSDEWFMGGMQDLVLQHAPSTSFGSLMAILAPCVCSHINDVTLTAGLLRHIKVLDFNCLPHIGLRSERGNRCAGAFTRCLWTTFDH